MADAGYQTIKLSKGKHRSPEGGACVMELASMLAEEPFSDHPESVCPVIGCLLRAYNDSVDDIRRQGLYEYAAKVVGSRAPQHIESARAERMMAWMADHRLPQNRSRLARLVDKLVPCPPLETLGASTIYAIATFDDDTRAEILGLVDELLAIGASKDDDAPGTPATTTAEPARVASEADGWPGGGGDEAGAAISSRREAFSSLGPAVH